MRERRTLAGAASQPASQVRLWLESPPRGEPGDTIQFLAGLVWLALALALALDGPAFGTREGRASREKVRAICH